LNEIRDETSTYARSKKLAEFLEKIRDETSREIVIEWTNPGSNPKLSGVPGRFIYDPPPSRVLRVLMDSDICQHLKHSDIEEVIAHEATHGLLIYAKGYGAPVFKRHANHIEEKSTSYLFSMIDDIVVNTILQDAKYSPLGSVYLLMVKEDRDSIRKGEILYEEQPSDDPLLKNRWTVYRYVTAWSYLKYFMLEAHYRRPIRNFVRIFKKKCPKQLEMANQIIEVVQRNNIKSPEGRNSAVNELLKLWGLEDLVRLETVSPNKEPP